MSDSQGPVRRRRIAGESAPSAPAAKPPVKRPTVKKPVARKAPAAPATPAPAATQTPRVATRRPTKPVEPVEPAESVESVEARPRRAAGSRPSRRDVLWLVPATLVALGALVAGVLLVVDALGADDTGALDSSRRQSSAAAASAAETIFSFRHDQLDEHLATSKAVMTPAFAKEFDSIAPALTELAPQRKIVVQAVAREAAALPCGNECSADRTDVLVFVDQARLVGDATEPTVFANRIKVSMVRGDDGWLVSDIRAL